MAVVVAEGMRNGLRWLNFETGTETVVVIVANFIDLLLQIYLLIFGSCVEILWDCGGGCVDLLQSDRASGDDDSGDRR